MEVHSSQESAHRGVLLSCRSPDNEGDADPSINAPEIQPRKCNFVTIRNCCTDAAPETCQNGQYFKVRRGVLGCVGAHAPSMSK